VAKRVQFISRHNDGEQYIRESSAGSIFTITPDTVNPPLGRGSKIRLYLKEDQFEYIEEKMMKEIIKKHSEFISYPIQLILTKEVEKVCPFRNCILDMSNNALQEVDDDDDEAKEDDGEKAKIEEVDEDREKKAKKTKKIKENEVSNKEVNKTKPIRTCNPSDITPEEYGSFYKSLTNDWDDLADWSHTSTQFFAYFISTYEDQWHPLPSCHCLYIKEEKGKVIIISACT